VTHPTTKVPCIWNGCASQWKKYVPGGSAVTRDVTVFGPTMMAIPALLYRHVVGNRGTIAAGLLQATSLSFIVAAVQIGTSLGQITAATGAALIGAGLLSVMLFPLSALVLLASRDQREAGDGQ